MTPLPLHKLTPAAQAQALQALHRARRGRTLCVTLRFAGRVFVAWWADSSGVPHAFYVDGQRPAGRTCPWPRVVYRAGTGRFPMALTEEGVDHEAIAWAYEQDDAWWNREGWREVGDARA